MSRRRADAAGFSPVPALRRGRIPRAVGGGGRVGDRGQARSGWQEPDDLVVGVLALPGVTHVLRGPSALSRWFAGPLTGLEQRPDGSVVMIVSVGLHRGAQVSWTIALVRSFVRAELIDRAIDVSEVQVRVVLLS